MINIPGRLHSVATDGQVVGADEVFDDEKGKTQKEINDEILSRLNALEGNT